MNWKIRLPRTSRLPSGFALGKSLGPRGAKSLLRQISRSSEGVFSNTSLLSAVYYYNTNIIVLLIQEQHKQPAGEDWASALWGNVWSLKPPTPSISFKSYIWDTDYQYDDKDHKCGQSINHVGNIKMINMIKIITNLSPRCNPPLPPLLPPLMLQNLEMVNILGFNLI